MLLQVSAFIALMLIVGRRVMPWLLWQVTRTGSRELFTLAVITTAISIAYGAAQLFNVSLALGRSEEHTSELQSPMRISYAVFCLKKKKLTASSTKTHPI